MKPLSNILYIIKAVCTENESGSGLLNGFFNPFSFYPHLCNTFHYDRSGVKVFMNDRKYLSIFFSSEIHGQSFYNKKYILSVFYFLEPIWI